MMDWVFLGLLVGSLGMIGAYTVLIGENPISKAVENIYMGILSGYLFAMNWDFINRNAIANIQANGQYVYIISIILCLMLVSRLNPKWIWVSRYPVALTIGVGMGIAIRTTVIADFLTQVQGTIIPFNTLNGIVLIIGSISAITYFLWTTNYWGKATGSYHYLNQLGRLFLLVAFGVTYGQTVSMRLELVVGTMYNILLPDVAIYSYAFVVIIGIVLYYGYSTKRIKWYKS